VEHDSAVSEFVVELWRKVACMTRSTIC